MSEKIQSDVRKGLVNKEEFKNCSWTPVEGSLVMPVPVRNRGRCAFPS